MCRADRLTIWRCLTHPMKCMSIWCAVSVPVSLSKAGLSYNAESNCIQDRIRDWVVDMPDKGFFVSGF